MHFIHASITRESTICIPARNSPVLCLLPGFHHRGRQQGAVVTGHAHGTVAEPGRHVSSRRQSRACLSSDSSDPGVTPSDCTSWSPGAKRPASTNMAVVVVIHFACLLPLATRPGLCSPGPLPQREGRVTGL
ncbi:hypothetical protein XA68_16245 [Ophiocordyceps unilateralis]|uniref:Uncharacterized protein n=1 Tax=Ophiocordyceps unilateralis TaxID=268505 RepID=A0A2A9P6Q8_OPHUN|nr:hypothetical protein XA68_16245 [Ophiocordyceps unilateralis]